VASLDAGFAVLEAPLKIATQRNGASAFREIRENDNRLTADFRFPRDFQKDRMGFRPLVYPIYTGQRVFQPHAAWYWTMAFRAGSRLIPRRRPPTFRASGANG